MNNGFRVWLIVATALVIIGIIVFVSLMAVNDWDFKKLGTVKYQTNSYFIDDAFDNISIATDTADISFVLSDDGKCRVECYDEENMEHIVYVEDDTLRILTEDNRKWYEYIGINVGSPNITVYLPKSEYKSFSTKASTGDLKIPKDFIFETVDISLSTGDVSYLASATAATKITTSTGNINVDGIKTGELALKVSTGKISAKEIECKGKFKIKVSTGKVSLLDISCGSLDSIGNTGDISLENVIATQKLSIERSTGDISLAGCDAEELNIKTDTGDVKGSLLTDKIFFASTDTGKVDVPKTTSGGKCEITTNTGDIKFDIRTK